MNEKRLTLVNTSILTVYGSYTYSPLSLDEARTLACKFNDEGKTVQSAIGHQSTAELLEKLLGFPVPVNRMEFKQTIEDVGLVFKLKQRVPEGIILSREELEEIGYEFGLLVRMT